MAANDYIPLVEKIYVAFFGRPADPTGLAYYTDLLNKANAPTTSAGLLNATSTDATVAAIFQSFGNSNEAKTLYTGYTTGTLVNTIYNYVLGRNAESGGLAYWSAKVDTGQVSTAQLAFMILQAAENDTNGDALTVASKVAVASAYTASLDQPAEITAFSGAAAAASARALLYGVYAGNTAAQFQSQVDANILALTGSTGTIPSVPAAPTAQTFTLVAGADTLTGGTLNDTFNGNNNTFSAIDTLNGGAGIDTFNYTNNGKTSGLLPSALVSNIEIINIRNINSGLGGDTVDATTFTGATHFNSDRSTNPVSFDNMVAGQQVGVIGNSLVSNGLVTAYYGSTVPTSTVNFSGGTLGTAGVTLNGGALSAVTLTSTGAANATGAITLVHNQLTNLTINADTSFSTTGITGFKAAVTNNTVTVAGLASSVSLGTLDNTIGVVNASGMTQGGITATLGSNTGIQFTGGNGNDVITANALALAAGASVDAGAGTADRLVLTGAIASPASAARYTHFEELKLNNISQDLAGFTGSNISKLILDGGATVQNASSIQAANIQIMSSGTYNIGVNGATTVNFTVDDGQATTSTIALGTPVLAGIDTLKIIAIDNTSISSLTSATALNTVTLTGSATIDLTAGTTNFATTTMMIDATAATNTVKVDFQDAQSSGSGVTIKGGSGSNILLGSQKGDTIIGGSGNDFLATGHATVNASLAVTNITNAVTTGADTLTGGAGNDAFIISHSAVNDASSITDLNLGGNGTGGVDSLWFNGTGAASIVVLDSGQLATVSLQASLSAAVDAVLAIASATNNVARFNYGTDAYIVVNGAGTTTYSSTQDNLIKVTGVVGTLDATDINFLPS